MSFMYAGSILRVDLTTGKTTTEPTKKYAEYVGGRGINGKLVFDAVPAGADPLGPENAIVFGTGPLSGTFAPGSGRCEITAKSPVTGLLGMSNIGGYFAAELKFTGYDHVVVTGRAEKPVYLYINNDSVEIRDASRVWGIADAFETPVVIRKELGEPNAHVVTIGRAGENKVVYSSVITKLGNSAGRTGMGAVMGSKNLKAVAVRGTKGVGFADPDGYFKLCQETMDEMKREPHYQEMATIGTSADIDYYGRIGLAIAGNYNSTDWPESEDAAILKLRNSWNHKKFGCFNCPVRCLDFFDVPGIGASKASCQWYNELTWKLRISDMEGWWREIVLSQKVGLDPVAISSVLAWLMELTEKGMISEKDTDGIPMTWGNADSVVKMTEKICNRDGVGAVLADGVLASIEHFGAEAGYHLMHTKGSPLYNVNFINYRSKALALAIGSRGDHIRGTVALENLARIAMMEAHSDEEREERRKYYEDKAERMTGHRKAIYPNEYVGKGALVIGVEDQIGCSDLVLHCKWHSPWQDLPVGPEHLAKFLEVGLGEAWPVERLMEGSRRMKAIERAFDVREGLTRDGDRIPKRFFEIGMPGKFPADDHLDPDKFEYMKTDYYKLRGWDQATGAPTRATLESLGMKDVADALSAAGKLPVEQPVEVPVG